MNWSDILYPGNPETRKKLISRLIRRHQEFINLMQDNFEATNDLIKLLNERITFSFSPVTLNEEATVKENCDVLIERIRAIQAELGKIDKKLKEKLEPALYEKLKNVNLALPQDLSAITTVLKWSQIVTGVLGSAASFVVLCYLLPRNVVLDTIISKINYASSAIGGLSVVSLFVGIDHIISAIAGSMERDQLEKALGEYDKALKEFKPESKQYQEGIMEVRIRIEMSGK